SPYRTRVGQSRLGRSGRRSMFLILAISSFALGLSTGSSGCAAATRDRSAGLASCVTDIGAYIAAVRSVLGERQLHATPNRTIIASAFAMRAGPSARNVGSTIGLHRPHGDTPTSTNRSQWPG